MHKRLFFLPDRLTSRSWRRLRAFLLVSCVVGLLVAGGWYMLIVPVSNALNAGRALKSELSVLQTSASAMDITGVEQALRSSREELDTLHESIQSLRWCSIIPWIGGNISVADQLATTGMDVLSAFEPFWTAVAPIASDLTGVASGDSGGLGEKASGQTIGETLLSDLDVMDREMGIFRDELMVARFHLVSTSLVGVDSRLRSIVDEVIIRLDQADQAMAKANDLFAVMPALLGKDAAQTYLVIIQNNTELRATGGFIGNFGLLTVDNGRIGSLAINDVYLIDTDIMAARYGYKIPYPLGSYLQQQYLHFRDGNWWSDFPTSSRLLLDYFEFLTGTRADGVIALDPLVIEDIIRILGPIEMPEHNITVEADTVTYQIQYEVQKGFDDFATRKDFVSDLGAILFDRVMSEQGTVLKEIVKSVFADLEQKHLQVYSTNADIEQLLCSQRWCGEIAVTDGDFLQVVDSNIGINKVNFFATREIGYVVERDGSNALFGTVTIDYTNPSNWGWPGGAYISYLRVYVPAGSELISSQGFLMKPDAGVEYPGQPNEKTVFAGLVRVDVKSSQSVQLTYQLPLVLDGQEYRLNVQKQAGTPTTPGTPSYRGEVFTFSFTDGQAIYVEAPAGCVSADQQIGCVTDLTYDRSFVIAPKGI